MDSSEPLISVLCVDDNQHVADAIRAKLANAGGFEWKGWLSAADTLLEAGRREHPTVVIMDVDMPGRDPFEAVAEMAAQYPEIRAIMFSGYVRSELIDRAFDAGAWGYVSKNDGEDELVQALRLVAGGDIFLSPEPHRLHQGT